MKRTFVIVGVGLALAAGCSSGGGTSSSASTGSSLPRTVRMTEGEMFIRASATKLAAGTVTFTVTNQGQIHHEFVVVAGDPTGTKGDEPGRVSEKRHIGGPDGPEIGDIAPGQTKTMKAQLPPGTYTAMCNLPGHYAAGMHVQFVVQ